jgi:hypothetical protein
MCRLWKSIIESETMSTWGNKENEYGIEMTPEYNIVEIL